MTIDDEFWSPRLDTNRVITLERVYDHLKTNGCFDNFRRVVGEAGGEFEGQMFIDSDAYKWLEAASYTLATREAPTLERRVEELIELIDRVQAPDGYLHTYFLLADSATRWTNFTVMHELYCAGHLVEAAVAHYSATGEDSLLSVARRVADHIDDRFGPDGADRIPGHPEIELALVRLFRVTGERRYLDLAEYFVNRRGRDPSPLAGELGRLEELADPTIYERNLDSIESVRRTYCDDTGAYDGRYAQDHTPVREQEAVEGHAVRATYLYAGAAALLRESADPELFDALERLWTNLRTRRTYVTGGLGSDFEREAFTADYDLPNESTCAETCAAVGSVFWSQRMFELTGEAKYVDLVEQTLYNGVLSGVSLDGTEFSYRNPLETRGDTHREQWFYCACCPPNVARLLASLGKFVYARSNDSESLYVNLYVGGAVETSLAETPVALTQESELPWAGDVALDVSVAEPVEFTVNLRVPEWSDEARVAVNGEPIDTEATDGYVSIERVWCDGDRVDATFPPTVEVLRAHPDVRDDVGRVALRRGPIVYCLEATDNAEPVHRLILAGAESVRAVHCPELLGGVTVLEGEAATERMEEWRTELYRPIEEIDREATAFRAVPYYAWDNRDPGAMTVWMRYA
ncbi:glycoside hydrolase family 127 protein [Halopelagius longus]|uniref:glycoside hydrolase family 127 protein n=1 Tax=Halopelagius longus TaxID=1236180 RepID=UPI001FE03DA3|nr:beta-L-arabinofuranosidase domain-containing protein [Halopelagius longus]